MGLAPKKTPSGVNNIPDSLDISPPNNSPGFAAQFAILPNGQHWGNMWITPPFPYPEPERGRYTLTCDTCLRWVENFNWKDTSPAICHSRHHGKGEK